MDFSAIPEGSDFTSAITAVVGLNTANPKRSEVWYKYTAAVNSNVTISSCGTTSNNTGLELRDQNKYYLGGNSNTTCPGQSTYTLLVEAGKTIYIHWASSSLIDEWNLTSTPTGSAIPQGYSCSNPIVPVSGANSTAFQARQTWIWYKYTAIADGTLEVDNCNNSPGDFSKVYILSNCQFNDRNLLAEGNSCGENTSGASINLTSGQEVYIAWYQLNPLSGNFPWTLHFYTPATLPAGYSCSNPLTAVVGANNASTLSGDEFFTFTPANAGHLNISTFGLTTKESYVSVYQSCDDYTRKNAESGLNNPLVSKELTRQ